MMYDITSHFILRESPSELPYFAVYGHI